MSSVEALARAVEYPYLRPVSHGHSFLFINGQVYTFQNEAWTGTQGLTDMMVTPQQHCKLTSRENGNCPPIRFGTAAKKFLPFGHVYLFFCTPSRSAMMHVHLLKQGPLLSQLVGLIFSFSTDCWVFLSPHAGCALCRLSSSFLSRTYPPVRTILTISLFQSSTVTP